jgi:hypothetical protein
MVSQSALRRSTAAIVAAVAAIGLALAAAGSGHASTKAPALHQVNLHAQFEQALSHVKLRPRLPVRAGIVPVLGSKAARTAQSRTAAGCTEPSCDLIYNGGVVQHSPQIFVLLWGASWTNTDPGYVDMANMFAGLGGSQDYWSRSLSQYGDGSGTPGPSTYAGAWQDSSAEPDPVSPAALAAEADGFASYLDSHGYTVTSNSQIVVASPSGMCYTDGFGGDCGVPQTSGYCAWHSYSAEPFTNMPYQLDAGVGCGQNFINGGSAGTYDGTSMVAGHEFAETVTDPDPKTGWIDTLDSVSGGEVGDKCVWGGQPFGVHDPAGDITLSTGKFAMQSQWSNAAGGCVMTNDALTVTNPGSRVSVIHEPATLTLHATSSDGAAISGWSATGLPPGLGITTGGVISGRPQAAGTYTVTVGAMDAAQSQASTSFMWTVRPDTLTIAPVSRKVTIIRRLVHFPMHATSSTGAAISGWAAKGLPRGARITSAGVITGRPSRTGTFHVTVHVRDAAGSTASRSFTWVVRR